MARRGEMKATRARPPQRPAGAATGRAASKAATRPAAGRRGPAEPDDAALVRRCLARDQDAWRDLLRRYAGLIYSVPLGRGLGRDLAEEVFQSVATTLVERLHLIHSPDCLAKWLLVTTARRTSAVLAAARAPLPAPDPPEPVEDPERAASRRDLDAHVRAALAEIPARDRELLLDLFARDCSYTDIARRTGLKIGSLGPLRARALGRLEARLRARRVL